MKKMIITATLVFAFANVSLFAQEKGFVITQFRCADIADKANPDRWITLFNIDAKHHKSINIVSTWVELVDVKTDKVFARKKVEYIPIQDGRLFVAIGFKGAHTAKIYPSCILEYQIEGNEKIHRIVIQDPRKPVRDIPKELENKPVPKELYEQKPFIPRPKEKKRHIPNPDLPAPTAIAQLVAIFF